MSSLSWKLDRYTHFMMALRSFTCHASPATHGQIWSVLAVAYALRSFTAANMCACISTSEVSTSSLSHSVVKVLHGDNCRSISHSQANLLTCSFNLQVAFQAWQHA